jgi:hypothetical protein
MYSLAEPEINQKTLNVKNKKMKIKNQKSYLQRRTLRHDELQNGTNRMRRNLPPLQSEDKEQVRIDFEHSGKIETIEHIPLDSARALPKA